MSKKILFLPIILVMLALLTGCFPNGDTTYLGNSHQSTDIEHLGEDIENFVLDLTLPENVPEELPIIELRVHEWDTEKALEIFLGDDEITEYNEYDSDFYEGEKRYVYWTEDALFYVDKGLLTYTSNSADNKERLCSYMEFCYETEVEAETYDIECSFATRDEAVEMVRETLNELGVTNLSEPIVRGIDEQLAYKLQEITHPNSDYDPWEDGEFYYIRFSQVFEDVPIGSERIRRVNGYHSQGGEITAIVDKSGIVRLHMFRILSAEYKQNERVSVTPAAEALKTAVSYFEGQKLQTVNTLYDCKLVYTDIANEDKISFTFEPMWEFTYYSTDMLPNGVETDDEYISKMHVDYQNRLVSEL